jgi:putative DNA methylase
MTPCIRKTGKIKAVHGLIQSWPEITRLAQATPPATAIGTGDLFA